jgi:hypothetical protein
MLGGADIALGAAVDLMRPGSISHALEIPLRRQISSAAAVFRWITSHVPLLRCG